MFTPDIQKDKFCIHICIPFAGNFILFFETWNRLKEVQSKDQDWFSLLKQCMTMGQIALYVSGSARIECKKLLPYKIYIYN